MLDARRLYSEGIGAECQKLATEVCFGLCDVSLSPGPIHCPQCISPGGQSERCVRADGRPLRRGCSPSPDSLAVFGSEAWAAGDAGGDSPATGFGISDSTIWHKPRATNWRARCSDARYASPPAFLTRPPSKYERIGLIITSVIVTSKKEGPVSRPLPISWRSANQSRKPRGDRSRRPAAPQRGW